MYSIGKKNFGYKVAVEEFLSSEKCQQLQNELMRLVTKSNFDHFGIIFDMRKARPLSVKCEEVLKELEKKLANEGMKSAVIVCKSYLVLNQLEYLAKEIGLQEKEKFLLEDISVDIDSKAEKLISESLEKYGYLKIVN